ncbi:MAG: conjugal transfer transcriptional regulator TraJ [Pseudomonadota bacterium]
MQQDNKVDIRRRRRHHLRVPVFPEEKDIIGQQAKAAGLSVARYLRDVGQGYRITGIMDYEKVRELARISGDLGRLGGLLKLWLTNDERAAQFGHETIHALLSKIESTQDEMGRVMMAVVMPRKKS